MRIRDTKGAFGMKTFVVFSVVLLLLVSPAFAGFAYKVNGPNVFGGAVFLKKNLEGYFKFDDTSSSIVKNEVGSDGNNLGASTGATGIFGDALEFNADTGYVDTGINLGSQHTIAFNVRPDANSEVFGTTETGIDRNGYQAYYQSGELQIFYFENDVALNLIAADLVPEMTARSGWAHVTFTVDSSNNAKVYVRGTEVTPTTYIWDNVPSEHDYSLIIGSDRTNNNNGFDGTIDEVGVWKKALKASWVSRIPDATY